MSLQNDCQEILSKERRRKVCLLTYIFIQGWKRNECIYIVVYIFLAER